MFNLLSQIEDLSKNKEFQTVTVKFLEDCANAVLGNPVSMSLRY